MPDITAKDGKPSRESNLELLKALAIIAMVLCHPVIRLGIHCAGYENAFWFFFGDTVLGDYLAVAHAFMFAMGVGATYTKNGAPTDLMRRGGTLYLLGYLLGFVFPWPVIYGIGLALLVGSFLLARLWRKRRKRNRSRAVGCDPVLRRSSTLYF